MTTPTPDRIERSIDLRATPSRVWRALTNHTEFGTWFRVNLESPFAVGKSTRGRITYPGYEHLVMEVLVEAMEPERRFAFRWHPCAVEGQPGFATEPTTLVEFLLRPSALGTSLIVRESGFHSLPADCRDEAYRRNSGGWDGQVRHIAAHVEAA